MNGRLLYHVRFSRRAAAAAAAAAANTDADADADAPNPSPAAADLVFDGVDLLLKLQVGALGFELQRLKRVPHLSLSPLSLRQG